MLRFLAWILEFFTVNFAFISLIFNEIPTALSLSVITSVILVIFIKPVWNQNDREDWNIKLSPAAIQRRIKFYRVFICIKWLIYSSFWAYIIYNSLFGSDANLNVY